MEGGRGLGGDGGEDMTTTSVDISFWNLGWEWRAKREGGGACVAADGTGSGVGLVVQSRSGGGGWGGAGHRCGRLSHIHSLQVSCSRLLEEKRASR